MSRLNVNGNIINFYKIEKFIKIIKILKCNMVLINSFDYLNSFHIWYLTNTNIFDYIRTIFIILNIILVAVN